MNLSKLAISLGQSATLRLNELANNLKAEGKPVIHLGGGEPEEKIPAAARIEAEKTLSAGYVRYTPTAGTGELRKEIASYTKRHYGVDCGPGNIVVSSGAKQSIYNCLMAVVDPGDHVLFPAPYWVSYPEMIRMVHGVPVPVNPQKGTLAVTMSDIKSSVTSGTKAILVNIPGNPSGVLYGEDFVKELVEFCEERDIYLVFDDIYNRLVFDGLSAPKAFSFAKRPLNDSVLVSINGVSKTYSMTGFRIGWSVSSQALAQAMIKIQAQITSCPSALSQKAALGAIKTEDAFADSLREQLQRKRDILLSELATLKKVKVCKPQGTFYSFPDFSAYDPSSERLSNLLLEKAMVVTVPGKEFGLEGHLRISYCGPEKEIIEGIKRVRDLLDA